MTWPSYVGYGIEDLRTRCEVCKEPGAVESASQKTVLSPRESIIPSAGT